jgi:hypothetical protein
MTEIYVVVVVAAPLMFALLVLKSRDFRVHAFKADKHQASMMQSPHGSSRPMRRSGPSKGNSANAARKPDLKSKTLKTRGICSTVNAKIPLYPEALVLRINETISLHDALVHCIIVTTAHLLTHKDQELRRK